jgi:hypothetical protein
MDDDVGPGLIMWLPNGTVMIEELEKLAKETESDGGYKRVVTPHIAKENMYLTSRAPAVLCGQHVSADGNGRGEVLPALDELSAPPQDL